MSSFVYSNNDINSLSKKLHYKEKDFTTIKTINTSGKLLPLMLSLIELNKNKLNSDLFNNIYARNDKYYLNNFSFTHANTQIFNFRSTAYSFYMNSNVIYVKKYDDNYNYTFKIIGLIMCDKSVIDRVSRCYSKVVNSAIDYNELTFMYDDKYLRSYFTNFSKINLNIILRSMIKLGINISNVENVEDLIFVKSKLKARTVNGLSDLKSKLILKCFP